MPMQLAVIFSRSTKCFRKKNNKKPLYSSLSLIELAIFMPFPLAYSSDIANVSTGVRLESWQRSGEKRTLPHTPFLHGHFSSFALAPTFVQQIERKSLLRRLLCLKRRLHFIDSFLFKKKKFPVLKVTVPCLSRH